MRKLRMKIPFQNDVKNAPKVSIVLLDWSCRESFHALKYLAEQTVSREQYEVIWIEYYGRQSPEIRSALEAAQKVGKPPPVDQWIVMDIPENIYYHKHLMFNAGIVASRGGIVVICDSDAIVKPSFVENILKTFEADPHIVLHLDEIRNVNRKFYPFNNPSIEDLIGNGCINFSHGKTSGLFDHDDPLHARNYGACMCARRKDLIAIGGADEHIDYLGHICGPYEMTFRLVNAGKQEVWHQKEFLYHAWHPGTDGHKNYMGPHDGRNMSTTALIARKTGRILPLLENRAIRALRLNEKVDAPDVWLAQVFPEAGMLPWNRENADKLQKDASLPPSKYSAQRFWIMARLLMIVLAMTARQVLFKSKVHSENRVMPKGLLTKAKLTFAFIRRMWRNNILAVLACLQIFLYLKTECAPEAAVYGSGDIVKILKTVSERFLFKLANIESDPEKLRGYDGRVIIASFVGLCEKEQQLKSAGIDAKNIVRLL